MPHQTPLPWSCTPSLQGMPFCVAGMGDLLALFRCISCRFAFGTDVLRPTSLGAPGRVYTSSEVGALITLWHLVIKVRCLVLPSHVCASWEVGRLVEMRFAVQAKDGMGCWRTPWR